jgi:hypothetical protein
MKLSPPINLTHCTKVALKVLVYSSLSLAVLTAVVCWFQSASPTSIPFGVACSFLVFAFLWLLTLRPILSALVSLILVYTIGFLSITKFKYLHQNVHSLDVFFYGLTLDSFRYLGSEFPDAVRFFCAAIALSIVAFSALMFFERKPIPKRCPILVPGAAAAVAAFSFAPFASPAWITSHQLNPAHPISAPFLSLADVPRLFGRGTIRDRMLVDPQRVRPFAPNRSCVEAKSRPDIVAVLSESAVPPNKYDGWQYDEGVLESFKSFNGEIQGLKVEVFGGATWVSEFQFLTGLSAESFEWMKYYVTAFMEGRVHHSLPQRLADCGYRTIYMTTGPLNFANEGPFMASLGFEERYDAHTNNVSYLGRDKQYYDAAMRAIDRSRQKDDRPIFLFMLTSAAHAPYSFRLSPETKALGEPYRNEPNTEEYMRRLHLARQDLEDFRKALDESRRDRKVLLVEFGDHQPSVALSYFTANLSDDWLARLGVRAFETHYSAWPIGYVAPVALPSVPYLDIAYLGLTVMELSGVPLGSAYSAQRKLRDQCQGLFYTCSNRKAVDTYVARLARSGLVELP